uniref:Uncharacterized protein n=1 Tax=Physcomitrium patens TaxID=3218 RepID=A0A2K1L2U4_PHYPA|nr:hypothetical protein PHYPA_003143 [Physcomitrium patens]
MSEVDKLNHVFVIPSSRFHPTNVTLIHPPKHNPRRHYSSVASPALPHQLSASAFQILPQNGRSQLAGPPCWLQFRGLIAEKRRTSSFEWFLFRAFWWCSEEELLFLCVDVCGCLLLAAAD